MNNDCPLAVVNCDFQYVGCEVQLPRKDMPEHNTENIVQHCSLLVRYTRRKVESDTQEHKQQMQSLSGRVQKSQAELSELLHESMKEIEEKIQQNQAALVEQQQQQQQQPQQRRATLEKWGGSVCWWWLVAIMVIFFAITIVTWSDTLTFGDNGELATLNQDVAASQRKTMTLRQEIDQMEKREKKFLEQMATPEKEANQGIAAFRHKIMTLQEEIDQLQKREKKVFEHMATLEKDMNQGIASSRHRTMTLQEEIDRLQKREKNFFEQIATLENEITKKLENVASKMKATRLEEQINELEQTSKKEIDALKQQLDRRQNDNEAKNTNVRTEELPGSHESEQLEHAEEKQPELLEFTSSFILAVEEYVRKMVGFLIAPAVVLLIIVYFVLRKRINSLEDKQEQDRTVLTEHGDVCTVPPLQIIMRSFSEHKSSDDIWYSKPFYTHLRGYKMRLGVYANSWGDADVSIYIHLMRGDFDNELVWPFEGTVTIYLLNQFKDEGHRKIEFTQRVNKGERAPIRISRESLVSFHDLSYIYGTHTQYLKNDSLRFQVAKIDFKENVGPVNIIMTDFEGRKADSEEWCSEPFYTHPGGYKMCLRVDANGYNMSVRGTHVSVFVNLMKGEYDDQLKWPFRGDITIQLLNQRRDEGHWEKTVLIDDTVDDIVAGRVVAWWDMASSSRGYGQFIAHTELNTRNKKYLKNNCLKFRVSKIACH